MIHAVLKRGLSFCWKQILETLVEPEGCIELDRHIARIVPDKSLSRSVIAPHVCYHCHTCAKRTLALGQYVHTAICSSAHGTALGRIEIFK